MNIHPYARCKRRLRGRKWIHLNFILVRLVWVWVEWTFEKKGNGSFPQLRVLERKTPSKWIIIRLIWIEYWSSITLNYWYKFPSASDLSFPLPRIFPSSAAGPGIRSPRKWHNLRGRKSKWMAVIGKWSVCSCDDIFRFRKGEAKRHC